MLLTISRSRASWASLSLVALLSACSTQTPLPAEESASSIPGQNAQYMQVLPAYTLVNYLSSLPKNQRDGWLLVQQAQNQVGAKKTSSLLQAANVFVHEGHYSTVESVLRRVQPNSAALSHEKSLIQAQLALSTNRAAAALKILSTLPQPQLNTSQFHRKLNLEAAAASSVGQFTQSVQSRLELDALLRGAEQRYNQQQLVQQLGLLSPNQKLRLRASLSQYNIKTWLDWVDANASEQQLSAWAKQNPKHPANQLSGERSVNFGTSRYPKKIALLLPLSSQVGQAAQAFQRGFTEASAKQNTRSQIEVINTGDAFAQTYLHYQNAINSGADMIVGPFGRQAIASLNAIALGKTPTLLIGESSGQHPNTWGISLSPENEARAAAEKAISSGYRSAAVLRKNNAWGKRVADAFITAFESKGGRVLKQSRFQSQSFDFSLPIKQIMTPIPGALQRARLDKSKSIKDHRLLRAEMDVIFLAGSADDAKKILPQLRFYDAEKVPVLATSNAFSGALDPMSDADLSGLSFPEVPWMVDSLYQQASSGSLRVARRNLPFGGSPLDRFYALGFAAYQSIPSLNAASNNPWHIIRTDTMNLTQDPRGNLLRQFKWSKYTASGLKAVKP